MNELLTRMLAKKYSLRTNSCGYPKEVMLSYKLMEVFGEDIIKQLAFISNRNSEMEFLRNSLGEDAANLYFEVSYLAEKEFYDKYYSHMSEFKGITGIIKKVKMYNQINYTKVYELIDEYFDKIERDGVKK